MSTARILIALLAVTGFAWPCLAQQALPANGVLLIAKPGMADPRFRETVILATQAPGGHTVGVILNRPLKTKLSGFMQDPRAAGYRGTMAYGGPVMERAVVALFRSAQPPSAPAFHVLRGVYLSMHPQAIEPLLETPDGDFRLFAGFSGWAPEQLQSETMAGAWHMLPATEEIAFRADSSRLWRELIEKSRGLRTRATPDQRAILRP
jgi:putative transcriptional regulator